ncbi:flavin reductase family protein [Kribbella sp. NPDC055071]
MSGAASGQPELGDGVDAFRFREFMSAVCAPVTIVTTTDGGNPYGATVSSFASLSLDPPLISVAFDNKASLLPRLLDSKVFGVNLLGHGQAEIATRFATRGIDRFAGSNWRDDAGAPRLVGSAGWMRCSLAQVVPAGDHTLLFGLVVEAIRQDRAPLIYAYRTFGTHSRFADRRVVEIADQIAACAS